jgi:hypothetical protein
MMEERPRRRLDQDRVPLAPHREPIERLDRACGLALCRAEGGEVMQADETLRCFVHRLGIQRRGDAPGTAGLQRQRRAAVDDPV